MKPTSEILERMYNSSTEHKSGVFTRLYRYLLREDIYYAAYQKLYANNGAGTKGTDNDTADGFGERYVKALIEDLRNGTYCAKPVRRVLIPKSNGKMRPLGIPSFRDKLLQEVIRQILEAIYEPTFDRHSFGFRPNRSCHTALKQIKTDFTGVAWFIEGDIKGCSDHIDHAKLIQILERKIKDSKFINVIRQFLKAGYVEDWQYQRTFSGTPQGGIISPILANIYLSVLDEKVNEIKNSFDKARETIKTTEYRLVDNEMKRLSYWIDKTEDDVQRRGMLTQHLKLKKEIRTIPCIPRTNKKISYVRYADDWLIGVCGSKDDCEMIKSQIAVFLKDELNLTLSEEKTLITHSSNKVRFLGYDIRVRRNQQIKGFDNGRKARSLNYKVELSVPLKEKIEKFMFAKGIIRQKENGDFKPIHRAGLLNLSDSEIVNRYNAETRGICNYYHLASNYHTLDYFCYLMEYSCLKTLANKHKSSVRKIISQYREGKTWAIPYETKTGTKMVRAVKIADCKAGVVIDTIPQRIEFNWKTTIRQRLNAGVCELCSNRSATNEIHHVNNLKDLGNSAWEKVMKNKRRKTLVVCSECHRQIHC